MGYSFNISVKARALKLNLNLSVRGSIILYPSTEELQKNMEKKVLTLTLKLFLTKKALANSYKIKREFLLVDF